MSSKKAQQPMTRFNDAVLGAFSNLRPNETVDHLVRYLGTWSGSDKLFMVIQYTAKLLVPILRLRARLQYRAGLRKTSTSSSAESFAKLDGLLGDSRTLWRIWGLLPIFQWLISIERNPPATRTLLTIERLQGWSMLAYYPLEHIYYLVSHGILPKSIPNPLAFLSSLLPSSSSPPSSSVSKKRINLDVTTLSLWSTRFWALYVFLHFAHLWEDYKILKRRLGVIYKSAKAPGGGLTESEKMEIKQRKDAFWSEVVVNLGYLPLTVHWSLEKGLIKSDFWVAVFGLVAGIASFRTGWNAMALPSSPPPPPASTSTPNAERKEETKKEKETSPPRSPAGYDVA